MLTLLAASSAHDSDSCCPERSVHKHQIPGASLVLELQDVALARFQALQGREQSLLLLRRQRADPPLIDAVLAAPIGVPVDPVRPSVARVAALPGALQLQERALLASAPVLSHDGVVLVEEATVEGHPS